jgi:NAD+ synthase
MARFSHIGEAAETLVRFINDILARSGHQKIVLGLSGGVDSSLSAALACKAIGAANIVGLVLPYKSSSPDSEKHALEFAEKFGIRIERVEVSPMIDVYFGDSVVSDVRKGNKIARERMAILFDISAREKALVQGTSNKTEICLGYATWYGDAACSYNPLGGLYKHEVREMALHLGISKSIVQKHPTADLWPGQTDEGELGISYDMADAVLEKLIEEKETSLGNLTRTGADEMTIKLIVERLNTYRYKRNPPVTELLGGAPVPDQITLRD